MTRWTSTGRKLRHVVTAAVCLFREAARGVTMVVSDSHVRCNSAPRLCGSYRSVRPARPRGIRSECECRGICGRGLPLLCFP